MNILFDFINLQQFVGGAAAYTHKVLTALCDKKKELGNINILGLYDSNKEFIKIYDIPLFIRQEEIELVDINSYQNIASIIISKKIDSFFIACGQYYHSYDLSNISCHGVIVIHDFFDQELEDNRFLDHILDDNLITWRHKLKRYLLQLLSKKINYARNYDNIMSFSKHPNVDVVTVSEYSVYTMQYYFPNLNKNIYQLYSPHKDSCKNDVINNEKLREIIDLKKKYYLMVSTNRLLKNTRFVIETFKRIVQKSPNCYLLTIGYPKQIFDNHLILPTLSDSDLENAYYNAHALIFASLEEGFGYPPLEAMKYGIPVICSNVCSMPGIYEDSVLYFSPFYRSDLFRQIIKLEKDREYYVEQAIKQSNYIFARQQKDLEKLLELILNINNEQK